MRTICDVDFRKPRVWLTGVFFMFWGLIMMFLLGINPDGLTDVAHVVWTICSLACFFWLLHIKQLFNNNIIGSIILIAFGPLSLLVMLSTDLVMRLLKRRK